MGYSPLELAQAFLQTGELDDALDALNQHLLEHPEDREVKRLRIETLLRKRDTASLQQALDDIASLGEHEPEHAFDTIMRKATIYEELNELENALKTVREGLKHLPVNTMEAERLTERLVQMLKSRGAFDEALTVIQSMPHTWQWRQWEGDIEAEAGHSQRAIEIYTDALTLFDDHQAKMDQQWADGIKARLLLARGDNYQRINKLQEAAKDYDTGIALTGDDPIALFKRGLLHIYMGDVKTGIARCKQVYQDTTPYFRDVIASQIQDDERLKQLRDVLRATMNERENNATD